MIEISPKNTIQKPRTFNAFACAQGTRAVETPGTLAPPPREGRAAFEPAFLERHNSTYDSCDIQNHSYCCDFLLRASPWNLKYLFLRCFNDLICDLFMNYLWLIYGMVSFAKKNHPFGGVEYLKLPQVLGQYLLKLGAKSDAIELKWPDL